MKRRGKGVSVFGFLLNFLKTENLSLLCNRSLDLLIFYSSPPNKQKSLRNSALVANKKVKKVTFLMTFEETISDHHNLRGHDLNHGVSASSFFFSVSISQHLGSFAHLGKLFM